MLSADELITEISGKSGKNPDEIKKMIKDKQRELSDLVSEEGAAYIVGRELGVELIKDTKRELKVANIVPEMRNVDIVARIASIFEPREFNKNGKKGMVSSIILSDESGTIRLPLWNDEVSLIASNGLKQNDLIEVSGAWAKKDTYRDGVELRLGKRGRIKKLEDGPAPEPDMPHSEDYPVPPKEAKRMDISMLSPGLNAIVKGCLLQVYRKRPFFESCSQCGGRVEEKDGIFTCKEHGQVEPKYNLLLSGVIDDGTGNLRVVFFREQAEKLFGKPVEEVKAEFTEKGQDAFWDGFTGIGKELLVEGRIKSNELTKEMEILCNNVEEVNTREEIKRLLSEVGQ